MTQRPHEDDDLGRIAASEDLPLEVPGLADAVQLYPPDVLPGLDPLEILTASFFGFNTLQARSVLADPALLGLVRKAWDRTPPSPRLRERAASADELGRLTRAILAATGHELAPERMSRLMDTLLRDIAWVLLSSSLQSGAATKGARDASPDEWIVDDPYVATQVRVRRVDGGYRVTCVPEVDRGPSVLHLRWSDDTVTSLPVAIREGEDIEVEGAPPSPATTLVALAFAGVE